MAVRCAILDDYQNVVLKVADWSKVKGDVTGASADILRGSLRSHLRMTERLLFATVTML